MGIVKRDSIAITILSYIGVVVGYVNKILLFPNFLSEEQVGLTSILVSLAVMYAQFSALGINSTVVKFFPFFRTPDKRHNGLFFWSALGVSIGFLLFTALFVIFREPVMHYFSKESPLLSEYYLMLIPLGLATLFYNFYSAWLQALSRTIISSAVYDVLLRLLITAEISLYALGLIDFEQFMVGYIIIYFVPTLILLLYTIYLKESYLHPVVTSRTKKLVAIAGIYGLWQYLGGASVFLTSVIDQTMLAGMEGLMQGGIYAIMMYMVSAMLIPYRSMIKVATPVVTNLWKERDMKGIQHIHREMSQMNLIVGCFFFLAIWINLDNIFSLMPDSYSAGRYVFLFLGLGRVFEMYAGLTGVILITSKRYRYDFTFSILLVGLTVATNAALIPSLGMNGAAIATMITVVVYNLIRMAFVWKFFRLQPFAIKDCWVVVLTAAMIGLSTVIPYLGNFILDAAVRTLVISVIFGGVIYYSHTSQQLNETIDELLAKVGIRLPH